ncbi:hypothetical protein C8R43DRAFT_952755 [Mycena crocata]|nr:hypothetical protein C8R43DRAFT_952755 [Mycena crocata]
MSNHSIFEIVTPLVDLVPVLALEDFWKVLCTNPDSLKSDVKETLGSHLELLRTHWDKIPTSFQNDLESVLKLTTHLLKFRIRAAPNNAANRWKFRIFLAFSVRISGLTLPGELSSFDGVGFVLSVHAFPMMTSAKLEGSDHTVFMRLVTLYTVVCDLTPGNLPKAYIFQATWIRNPGPNCSTESSYVQGCIALGCNINVTHPGLRALILAGKTRVLEAQWPQAKGTSPMQVLIGDLGAEWAACAEAVPFCGLAKFMNAKVMNAPGEKPPHDSTYQIGVVALDTTPLRLADEESDPPLYATSDAEFRQELVRLQMIKEMCDNCNKLSYVFIGADVLDFALRAKERAQVDPLFLRKQANWHPKVDPEGVLKWSKGGPPAPVWLSSVKEVLQTTNTVRFVFTHKNGRQEITIRTVSNVPHGSTVLKKATTISWINGTREDFSLREYSKQDRKFSDGINEYPITTWFERLDGPKTVANLKVDFKEPGSFVFCTGRQASEHIRRLLDAGIGAPLGDCVRHARHVRQQFVTSWELNTRHRLLRINHEYSGLMQWELLRTTGIAAVIDEKGIVILGRKGGNQWRGGIVVGGGERQGCEAVAKHRQMYTGGGKCRQHLCCLGGHRNVSK